MTHSTSATAFVTLIKSSAYRGAREEWANVYHVDNVPASAQAWYELGWNIWVLERKFLTANTQIERLTGHEPGTPPPLVYEFDVPPAGEGGEAGQYVPTASEKDTPLDVAMWIRYGTTQKTVLGKPIYLRNYYHDVHWETVPEDISPGIAANMNGLGTALVAGVVGGTQTFRRAGPRGAVAQNHQVGQWSTTRTLHRRGKRKKTTQPVTVMGDGLNASEFFRWIIKNVGAA